VIDVLQPTLPALSSVVAVDAQATFEQCASLRSRSAPELSKWLITASPSAPTALEVYWPTLPLESIVEAEALEQARSEQWATFSPSCRCRSS